MPLTFRFAACAPVLLGCLLFLSGAAAKDAGHPWMNTNLSADQRAELVVQAMTLDEKLSLLHGEGWGTLKGEAQPGSNGGSGFARGIPRLSIPNLEMDDAATGVRLSALHSRYSTALPSVLGMAASWNTAAADLYGKVIGRELRAQGYNGALGGGINLVREPRGGRNFEYAGEDPVLAGTIVGNLVKGIQSQQVMGDIKHYALNDQETLRYNGNVVIGERAMRESDLLAFEIALRISDAAMVMCAYNKVNGDYACESDFLLNRVLKQDFGFKGFVMSDWGGTHSTVKAALAGLDQEQPMSEYFGDKLKAAVLDNKVPMSRIDDMARRILRSMFATGVIDNPPVRRVVDPFRGRDDAQSIAEQGIVLLKNANGALPLSRSVNTIAVIGGHADVGVMGGSGSSLVDPPGGELVPVPSGIEAWMRPMYHPSSPLKAIRAKAPDATVEYDPGIDPAKAAKLAAKSQVAIVFVTQYMTEARDAKTLGLPDNQDALIAAVARANPNTIVVIESGSAVTMPWLGKVVAVVEAWYPGIGGGQAIANVLYGDVNPSGKLPVTFPASEKDLPHPVIAGTGLPEYAEADIRYPEGARVGYKWYESEGKPVLFPFGYGLSYTQFEYSQLSVSADAKTASVTLRNSGQRAGAEVAQLYAALPDAVGEKHKRLVAWQRVELAPGESRTVTFAIDPQYLSIYDTAAQGWKQAGGTYRFYAGGSSADMPTEASIALSGS